MLKNHRNTLQAKPGQPQPLQWADCHIPHIDTLYPGTRSLSERLALTANSGNGQPPAASLIRPSAPLVPWSLNPCFSDPYSLFPVPCLCTSLPSKGNQSASANPHGQGSAVTVDLASSAPRPAPGVRNVCRNSMHLHDSASHPRFYFRRDSPHKATPAETTLPSKGNHPRLRIRSRI